jgi:ATP-dependent RNA helicase DHX33
MTDGMAIRELMIGKIFDVFVIDEAHERSINTDVLMALLKDKIKNTARTNEKHKNNRYKNLKIIIMSATI